MLKTILILCLCVTASCSREGQPGKQDFLTPGEWTWISEHGNNLRYSYDPSYPPVDFRDEHGVYSGITSDYLDIIQRRLNIRIQVIPSTDWSDVLKKAKNREIDLIGGISKSEHRLEYLNFTQPYISFNAIIATRNNSIRHLTIKNLKNLRTGVSSDYLPHEYLRTHYPDYRLTVVPNDYEGLKLLTTGEIDAMITDLPGISYNVDKYGISNLRVAGEIPVTYNLSFASRKDMPMLNHILIKTLASISEEEHKSIREKWITVKYRSYLYSESFWKMLILSCTIIILTIVLILLWNRTLQRVVKRRTLELETMKNNLQIIVENRTRELRETNRQLKDSLYQIKTLKGFIPICASCKKIRNDEGYWKQVETYIEENSEAVFTHSMCPECTKKFYDIDTKDTESYTPGSPEENE